MTCLIDGTWVDGRGQPFTSVNPATEEVIETWTGADVAQVDAAVAAARRGFAAWRTAPADERAAVLRRLADLIDAHSAELADLVVAEVGSPLRLARTLQVGQPAVNFRWFADAALRGPLGGREQHLPAGGGATSVLLREPIGVVAAITPYNYPVNMISWKVGPALAAGCSVVLLPSPRGALCSVALVRLAEEAGVPPGVLNLVPGDPTVGERLAGHPDVDLVTFTGSNTVGSRVMELAARNTTKVVLELGGKSPNLVLPGADLDPVVGPSMLRFCRNAGQGCGATTRILVHDRQYDEFVDRARAFLKEHVPVGDPRLPSTEVGPLITAAHRDRVEGYLRRAVEGGGSILAGGARPSGRGYFLEPTLVGDVDPRAEICQEELFAPVAVVLRYATVDEAVRIANATRYGLNAVVWGDVAAARAVADRLDSGTVAINGGGDMRPDVPWGGTRRSGVGAEMGEDGYREFFRVKHVSWRT
jgi:aldehyde dehydrogenase (NAD+)/betaine-aldehyde dehydrogenase